MNTTMLSEAPLSRITAGSLAAQAALPGHALVARRRSRPAVGSERRPSLFASLIGRVTAGQAIRPEPAVEPVVVQDAPDVDEGTNAEPDAGSRPRPSAPLGARVTGLLRGLRTRVSVRLPFARRSTR